MTNSLETFSNIIPCGLKGRGVINLEMSVRELSDKKELLSVKYEEVEQYLAGKIKEKLIS